MAADRSPTVLIEGRDYTIDPAGRWVFSRSFLQSRGKCCASGCQNCPYRPTEVDRPIDAQPDHR
jgi:hypothetical protein